MEKKYTYSGFAYYDKLPENFRKATLDDFTREGKRRLGMIFLIQWADNEDVFQICEVSINLTSDFLAPFIDDDRVYVEKEVPGV